MGSRVLGEGVEFGEFGAVGEVDIGEVDFGELVFGRVGFGVVWGRVVVQVWLG